MEHVFGWVQTALRLGPEGIAKSSSTADFENAGMRITFQARSSLEGPSPRLGTTGAVHPRRTHARHAAAWLALSGRAQHATAGKAQQPRCCWPR
jgi:hypothetical protein